MRRIGEEHWVAPTIATEDEALWRRLEEAGLEAATRLKQERERAERLLTKLLALPAEEQLLRVRVERRHRTRAVVALLLERGASKPEQSEHLASLALAIVAEGLREGGEGTGDLAAAAQCLMGDARRSRGDLDAAETAFVAAARSLIGSTDAEERARFCLLLAVLRRDQGRSDEALGLLGRAAELLRELGSAKTRASALIEFAFIALDAGESERGFAALEEAEREARREPELALRWAQGMALAHAFEGRGEEAMAVLAETRTLHAWDAASVEGLDLVDLEGRLALSLHQLERAERLLSSAFRGYLGRGAFDEAAVAALRLAVVRLELGRPEEELVEIAEELAPVLTAPEISDPSRDALMGFVADATSVSAKTLRDLARLLEQRVHGRRPWR
jgi:hypothetical protein